MSGPVFNPSTREFLINPYPHYAQIMQENPAHWLDNSTLVLSTYEDVKAALSAPQLSVATIPDRIEEIAQTQDIVDASRLVEFARKSLVFTDGDDHRRLKKIMQPHFSSKRIAEFEQVLMDCADRILDELPSGEEVDLISRVAHRLSQEFLCAMFGLSHEEGRATEKLAAKIRSLLLPRSATINQLKSAVDALDKALEVFKGVSEHVDAPMLNRFRSSEGTDTGLSAQEVLMMCVMTYVAGHETSQALIANTLVCMAKEIPERFAEPITRQDARQIILETLRFEPPLQIATRTAKTAGKIGRHFVEQGRSLLLLVGAANRDEQFFELAHTFWPERPRRPHLAFGIGSHSCLGSQLAIMEAEIMLVSLLKRFEVKLQEGAVSRAWRPSSAFMRSAHFLPATVVAR